MRRVYLDISQPCPGTLCNVGHPKVIGCAMGEVLFQAGIPLDLLRRYGTTRELFQVHRERRKQLLQWLGIQHYVPMESYSHVESAYDSFVKLRAMDRQERLIHLAARRESAPTTPDSWIDPEHHRAELIENGRRINVEFVIGMGPDPLVTEGALSSCSPTMVESILSTKPAATSQPSPVLATG